MEGHPSTGDTASLRQSLREEHDLQPPGQSGGGNNKRTREEDTRRDLRDIERDRRDNDDRESNSRYGGDTPASGGRPLSEIGTSPSDAYTPSSHHSLSTGPQARPINAVLAAFANSDLQYSGIMRPHEGVSYDRRTSRNDYDPSPTAPSNSLPDRDRSNSNRTGGVSEYDRDDRSDRQQPQKYSPRQSDPRYSSAAHMRGHHHASAPGSGPPSAPGPGSDHSPNNPPSHPYDRATPPQLQGYRSYLPSSSERVDGRERNGTSDLKRDADRRDDDVPVSASGDRSRLPWEEGYREPPGAPSSTTNTANDSPSEPPAKKRRRAKAAPNQDIPEGAEVEYEDPGGDRTRGPVFVHPPKGAVQACIRCHRIKRKCDGAWPRCASCARVDVACVFELSAATSSYVHKLKKNSTDLVSDLRAAEARINALEMQIADGGGAEHGRGSMSDFSRLATSVANMRDHAPLNFLVPSASSTSAIVPGVGSPPHGGGRARHSSMHSSYSREGQPALHLAEILPRDDVISAAQAYFDFNNLAYPFLERNDIVPEMLELYDTEREKELDDERRHAAAQAQGDPAAERAAKEAEDRADRRKYIIYMMLACGRSHAVRLGDDPSHAVDRILYAQALRYRAKALGREDMLCVQALLLMTIYAMDVPETGSIWQTLGLAGRVAMAIGLHRRADAHVPVEMAEPRRRLFYSFYNLDRFIASTFSKPLTIAEHDIDIELPTDRPTDQPYRGWPVMHICRYLVRYRRLLGCTLTALYSVNGEQNALPEPERRAIIGRLHEELEAWAADGPDPKGLFTVRTINHDKWLAIHYHQLLCMLYRPSPLYPDTTPATLRALHDASAKCVDLYCEMWTLNKVTFNLPQIVGLFVCCISLLCCLCECDTRMHSAEVAGPATTAATLAELGLPYSGVDDPLWAAEIRNRVDQCRSLFETFGRGTPLSAKYRDIFTRVSELLLTRYGPLHRDAIPPQAAIDFSNKAEPTPEADTLAPPAHDVPMVPADKPLPPAEHVSVHVHDDLAGDIAGAWDAMSQLWYDVGDLFGEESYVPPAGSGSGMPGLAGLGTIGSGIPGMSAALGGLGLGGPLGAAGVGVGVPAAAIATGAGVGGTAYPALSYPQGYGYNSYPAYAASYPGPYGPYGEGGFEDNWAEHWRPDGEGWWGHM